MSEDLSQYHAPVTRLFPAPPSPGECDEYRLTDGQVAFYEEQGYLAGVRVLDEAQVEALRAELTGLMNPSHAGRGLWYEYHSNESADPGRVLFHALGAWRIAEGFHDLLWNPRFTVPASQLLCGAPVRFWHDQLFCKPARHGGVVAWHQDYSYWTRTTPLAHLTCWVGLDDSTRENGCVNYVPGSHRWADLPRTGLAGDMDAILTVLTDEQRELFRPVAIELKAGEASFHHPRMIHGSYANSTERPRRATVINVFRDGVRSNSDAAPLAGVPVVPRGQPMGGRFFPLLFDGRNYL
ncbi:MAG: phytanoyl-CoA dioxygenase family protein [Acidobacteria bacterium]|nr:phytanoyl-CoA dioxygenase family protein [Acidobacteriota bacterium]MCA1621234.1 phytanoyl-CoA dioxygenase family protein [Acidobacteriota bacterium]